MVCDSTAVHMGLLWCRPAIVCAAVIDHGPRKLPLLPWPLPGHCMNRFTTGRPAALTAPTAARPWRRPPPRR
jgi:hypothetical protein